MMPERGVKGLAGPGVPAALPADLLREIGRAFYARDLDACQALLEGAPAVGEAAEVDLWRARLAARRQDWAQLLLVTEALLAKAPTQGDAPFLRARALSRLERWDEAVEAWERIADTEDGDVERLCELATALMGAGRRRRAGEVLARLLALGASDPATLRTGAEVATAGGALAEATAMFASLAMLDLGMLDGWIAERLERGDLVGAAAALAARPAGSRDAALDRGALGDALLHEAIQAERADRLRQAFVGYAAAALVSPVDRVMRDGCQRVARALAARVAARVEAGALDEAEAACRDALSCDPANFAVQRGFARLLSRLGKTGPAVAAWQELARLAPGDARVLGDLARAEEAAGELTQAMSTWGRVLEIEPADARAGAALDKLPARMISQGRALLERGRLAEAWGVFAAVSGEASVREDALRRRDKVARQFHKTLRDAFRAGDLARVVAGAEAARRMFPDDAAVERLIGRAALKLKAYPPALASFTRLVSLQPVVPADDLVDLARALAASRRPAEAAEAARRALSRDPANGGALDLLRRIDPPT